MRPSARSRIETKDVYRALVSDLSQTTVPTSIMGLTLVVVGLFSYGSTGIAIVLAASAWGGLASAAKIALMRMHVRREARGEVCYAEAVRWEAWYAASTFMIAASVGVMTAAIFLHADLQPQLLATSLIFGYGSGVVSRTSIRPRIAIPALLIATIPPIAASALWNDAPHHIVALFVGIFLLGGIESVRHVHRTAVKHIGMRLDMASLARNDPLTGIANRLGLREAFRATVLYEEALVAVHYLDLDGFKAINDRFGHAAGDGLLTAIAQRLLALMPVDAICARVGGDEFVILQPNLRDEAAAVALAHEADRALREPFEADGQRVVIGVSIGYALSAAASSNLDELLRRADEASYRAKRSGGGVAASTDIAEVHVLRPVA